MHIGDICSFFDKAFAQALIDAVCRKTTNIFLGVEMATILKVKKGQEINTYIPQADITLRPFVGWTEPQNSFSDDYD